MVAPITSCQPPRPRSSTAGPESSGGSIPGWPMKRSTSPRAPRWSATSRRGSRPTCRPPEPSVQLAPQLGEPALDRLQGYLGGPWTRGDGGREAQLPGMDPMGEAGDCLEVSQRSLDEGPVADRTVARDNSRRPRPRGEGQDGGRGLRPVERVAVAGPRRGPVLEQVAGKDQ